MAQNEGPSDPSHKEQLAQGALNGLQREFLVVGKTRVKSWHAWLLIGLAVGIVGGIVFAANRDGEFTPIQAVVESDVEKVTPGIFEGDVRELPRIEPPRPGEPEREIPRGQVYISSLTPNSGPIGTKVKVTGFRFTAREKNTIHFGSGVIPDLTALKDSETLTFAVPESIGPACLYIVHPCDAPEYMVIPGTYSVWVTNANGTSNSIPFTVTSHQRVLERVREQVSELKMTEGETVKIPGTEITIRARKVTDQAELEVMQGRATKVLALYRSETPGTAKGGAFGSSIELVALSGKQITLRVTSSRGVPTPVPTPAPAPLPAPSPTILPSTKAVTIDFAVDEGPVTYRASGSFNAANVQMQYITPVKPQLLTWIPWVNQTLWQGNYKVARALNIRMQTKLGSSGMMKTLFGPEREGPPAYMPGDKGDWTKWEEIVRGMASQVVKNNYVTEYDIWNEPDNEFPQSGRQYSQYLEMWKRTVLLIRQLHPNAVIVGPSSTYFPFVINTFLPYAAQNNVLPGVLSWHGYDQPGKPQNKGNSLSAEVAQAKKFFTDRNIPAPKISINEYLDQVDMVNAGVFVKYFYELERAKVDSAAKGGWNETPTQPVGSALFNNLLFTCAADPCSTLPSPRSIWWALKGYADITGRLVGVRPYQNIYGVAGQDSTKGEARMVLGRAESTGIPQTITVQFTNLNTVSFLAGKSTIRVEAERVPASGTNASASPTKVISQDYPVSGNILQITLPNFGPGDVYTLILRAPSP